MNATGAPQAACLYVVLMDQNLHTRDGLPDALRVLVKELPREAWEAHPEFGGMVQFWLERHLMFRQLLDRLERETQSVLSKTLAPDIYAQRLSKLGGFFLQQLHGHHHIEDTHYFPQLVTLDARIEAGFTILDADHHALDALLSSFADGANAVLRAAQPTPQRDASGALEMQISNFQTFLNRHLTDEEELIVPVILKTGFDG